MSNGEHSEGAEVRYGVRAFEPDSDLTAVLLTTESGDELLAPASGRVRVNVAGRPGLDAVEIAVELREGDRRYRITELRVVGDDISLGEVAGLPVARWLNAGISNGIVAVVDGKSYRATDPMPKPSPNWSVATTYSVAQALRANPTKAVSERFGVSHQAAAQRVKRARAAGLLPPTTPGKAS